MNLGELGDADREIALGDRGSAQDENGLKVGSRQESDEKWVCRTLKT